MAISILYNPAPMRIFEADGDFASGAKAFFYLARTTTPLTVYTDAPITTAHTWPVVADAYGLLPPIYIEKGDEYKVRIEDALGSLLYAADGIDNPAEGESGGGGGGGITDTSDQIFQTGDMLWQPITGTRPGWVRCNGRTISKAAGTGTESHDDDNQALFAFLWNGFPDSVCPVSGGRGANPTADWDVAKTIGTLDMRGRTAAGLDTMGNTAAEIVQVETTINTTNNNATIIIGSGAAAAKLAIGMFIVAPPNVPAGRRIADITGSTVTMSGQAVGTATGIAARFSIFADAQLPGYAGGEHTHTQALAELVQHNHTGASEVSGSAINLMDSGNFYAGASNRPLVSTTGTRWPVGQITVAGLTQPFNIVQPARLGTWFVKK
jgi:hypothetical protein